MSSPSREEVEALIARLSACRKGYGYFYLADDCHKHAGMLTALLALAFDKDAGEKYIERAAISEELRQELLARLSEVEKALELIASLGGRTLLGPEWDTERHHEMGAAKAFEQSADIARAALHHKEPPVRNIEEEMMDCYQYGKQEPQDCEHRWEEVTDTYDACPLCGATREHKEPQG